ncbi:IS21 family transposase [Paraburkholderia phytofirmans]|uniref:Integrase catalytic region n=1 Tax=Paraburkholderia phytofirmans (strain DSM 17436 / LMG 22146 / PsJN) TaxID=398527 RepID=B2T1Z6_PARPJ|nr:IS21 family transposase [Paraburkholderia phytofirmans]ACD15607.1 Integrase catalytic region [Paraburkholderia phytofirmans PsJN]ACD18245.1 Integrase catalytic region [Paraburkholderia phytofirmans PsJN]ACD20748.1 Integrase catalytic region [Paraburkholderia phytofirmans PsJN]
MYQYRQVLVRMRQGDSDRDIDRSKIMGRKKLAAVREIATERGWLSPGNALPDDTQLATAFSRKEFLPASCISSAEPWREQIAQWHDAGVPGTTIHGALVRNHGYEGSYSSVYRLLQQLKAELTPDVPMRLEFKPADAAQVDFGAGPTITDAHTGEIHKTWFFVMTLCWSRHQYVEFVRDQSVDTWLLCHRHAFEWFNGVVARVIIDNPKCAIVKACIYEPEVQRAYAQCAEGYSFKVDPCPPRDPAKKGIVESGVKYVKSSFLPLREFRDLDDANRQAQAWVMQEASTRTHGTTREVPLKRFEDVEQALLLPLPDVQPELATWARVKVHRDAHVQFQRAYYSVPFRLAGKDLWLKATATMVQLYYEHELSASHVRQTAPGTRSTVADHMPPAAQAWQLHDTQWCLREAQRIGPSCHALVHALFGDQVLIKLRAVQGVLRFAQQFGASRLEAACRRANHFGTPSYKAVKLILQKGLDQSWLSTEPAESSATTYTHGGRFCRDTQTLLIH